MSRRTSVLGVVLLLVVVPYTAVFGATFTWDIRLDPSEVRFIDGDGGEVQVYVDGYRRTNYMDYPALPYRVLSVLLPQGEDVESYRLDVVGAVEMDESVSLVPFEGEYRDDGLRLGVHVGLREDVVEGSVFPRWRVRHLGTSFYRGYRVASFAVYPIRYDLDTGRLVLEGDSRLTVETGSAEPVTERLERLRYVRGFRDVSRGEVESMVINPGVAAGYMFDEVEVDDGGRGFLPSYFPSMEGSDVAYLIITNEEMSPAFEVLADWKTRKGVPAVVRTIEWIAQNYRSGADLGESVRIFIQEAYAKWGVEWVLLGGDVDIIPARYGFTVFSYYREFIPTDMYYSCLDGTWNADGDSLWGEAYHDAMEPGDDADLYSEVYLGRLPASTYAEAELLVGKVISYSTPVDTLSKKKVLLLGEVIFPSDYVPGGDIILDGAEILQSVYTYYLEGNPDVVTSRLYETCALYEGSICLTKATALDSLDEGTNHVAHAGHGFKYTMSVGDGSIINSDAYNLQNGDALFSMYLMNCTNVAFDTDCLAEYFMMNPNGGAFAVTGCSRSAFPSASRPYLDSYYYLVYEGDVVQLAKAHVKSREPYTPSAYGETSDRWTHFIYNYLGDPEVSMFVERADTFSVSIPPSAVFGPNDISVEVYSDGSPYDSALVCLYKEGDDYAYDFTDVSGTVLFEDFLCKSGGRIDVTVTGLNHCRYMDSIQVAGETGPYLRVNKNSIEDNLVGNDDGVLDAGETVALRSKLENTGQSGAEKLYAILRTSDPDVVLTDSVVVYPDIPAGGKSYGVGGFIFSVDSAVADEKPVEFTIDIHDSTGGFWSEGFAFEVHAPQLELFVNTMSDTLPYGNDNGIIELGESFLLKIGVKNFGTGTVCALEGKIRSTDPDFTITDSVSSYGDLSILDVSYGDGFVLSESNVVSNNYYTFELTDSYGRVLSWEMELRVPLAPTGLMLNASYGPTEIHCTWHPPDENEAYRYMVYHSLVEGGPYEDASRDPVMYTLFRDYGLDPSTRYYYVVSAVDSCGNEGPSCSEASAATNPPQLAGWPNMIGKESSSGPKVADIDGDSHPEVVIGAEYVYAWHGDGIEVRDGDNQPLTWGILNTEGDNFTATVALADIDGEPGNEIVGASWNTKEIYIFDHDGNTLPGWPQSTASLCWASPVVGDLDDDGDHEIIAYDVVGKVYAWHHDGTEVRDGDDNPATNGVFFLTGSTMWHVSTPALADIDEDGVVELVVCAPDDSIYCLNVDGSSVPGWPVQVVDAGANISASPAVGDIDGDGHQEIVVQSSSARVYGLNHDGTSMSGWPKWIYSNNFFAGSPALADLAGDDKLEVIIPGMDGQCYILNHDGTPLPNWPQEYASSGPTEGSPVIADINGDGSLDIIQGSEEGRLSAWDVNGDYIPGFPIMLSGFLRGTQSIRDLDQDGDMELVSSCWDQNVYVWDLDGYEYHGSLQWNGFHGNIHNTGWKEFIPVTAVEGITCEYEFIGGSIELRWVVSTDVRSWNLYRSEGEGEYEFLHAGLRVDGGGIVRYVDGIVEEGLGYRYRLEAEGEKELYFETEVIEVPVVHARLYQNHPNPFNPVTTIVFTVPGGVDSREGVLLAVYDPSGACVKTLVNGVLPGGRYEVRWDGRNERGRAAASGVYFSRLSVGGFNATKKMVLIR